MASITKVGESWRVQIRKKGVPDAVRTFRTKAAAEDFAQKYESKWAKQKLPPEVKRLKRIPHNEFSGVYFLFKNGECVYVGQSLHVHLRTYQHRGVIDYDEYAWLPTAPECLDAVEKKYIQELRPAHNVALKTKPAPFAEPIPAARDLMSRDVLAMLRGDEPM